MHRARPGERLAEAKRRIGVPMRGELPTVTARTYSRALPAKTGWSRFVAVVSNPELHTIIAFSVIGVLLMLNFALLFPDFGQIYSEAAQFP
jgi:hypothetical protein